MGHHDFSVHTPREEGSVLRGYLPAMFTGVALGLLLLAVVAVGRGRGVDPVPDTGVPPAPVVVPAEAEIPLGAFGLCVQGRLTETAPDGNATEAVLLEAQQACLSHLAPGSGE